MSSIGQILDVARSEREYLRWVILSCLWYARPYGTVEAVILGTCRDLHLRVTTDQVRAEMVSLAKRGLITVDNAGPVWSAEITPAGEAIVDYRADCPPDIARPPRW